MEGHPVLGTLDTLIYDTFFFVKDRVDSGKFKLIDCPTSRMLADIFAKLLQGSLFKKFKKVIMGWADINTLDVVP